MSSGRLSQQIAFLVEADKLKRVNRRTRLIDASRAENTAEHSWHLVIAAIVLREYAVEPLDLLKVLELVALHDLVEIDAGDTFAYDADGQATKAARERVAADRIFDLLPADQRGRVRSLWDEFEGQRSPESRFAHAIDRLQPLLQDASSGGGTCHNQQRDDVLKRMAIVQEAAPSLWPTVIDVVDSLCASGVIRTAP